MQFTTLATLCILLSILPTGQAARSKRQAKNSALQLSAGKAGNTLEKGTIQAEEQGKDRAITQVVKLLQDMLDKSKNDQHTERMLYAKFKCYCDMNLKEKKQELKDLAQDKGLLESKVDAVQSDSSLLSKDANSLKEDMANNEQARNDAQSARDKEKTAFDALEKDLKDAIDRINQAIVTLSEVGGDQTMSEAADHAQFMAGHKSLVGLKSVVKEALLAAKAVITPKRRRVVEAFLQGPFTGTYTSQSGEVVGILKDMRDTFSSNLATAQASETKAAESHTEFMDTMNKAYKELEAAFQAKQGSLSTDDSTLGTKKDQLNDVEGQQDDAMAFLAQLKVMCAQKAKEYQERKALRTDEQAAIAQAIAVLNSDAAFETFGKVSATKNELTKSFFLQEKAVHKHKQHSTSARDMYARQLHALRQEIVEGLRKAVQAKPTAAIMVARIAALIQGGNPFQQVLDEIETMLRVIEDEEKADDKQLKWCESERGENEETKGEKESQITTLEGSIAELTSAIEEPKTGLKDMIEGKESALQVNYQNQKTETQDRIENNLAYQKDIENLVEAKTLLSKAVTVLKGYYSRILTEEGESFLQQEPKKEDIPKTWEGDFKGSSEKGTDAISMLDFILESTKKEEEAAHEEEKSSQHIYEDSMKTLKTEETELQTSIADLRQSLAQKEEELLGKEKDLKATLGELVAIKDYLSKIKPGCDFITEHIEERKSSREAESQALVTAHGHIKGSPAYVNFEAKKDAESGKAKEAQEAADAVAEGGDAAAPAAEGGDLDIASVGAGEAAAGADSGAAGSGAGAAGSGAGAAAGAGGFTRGADAAAGGEAAGEAAAEEDACARPCGTWPEMARCLACKDGKSTKTWCKSFEHCGHPGCLSCERYKELGYEFR